MKSPNLRRVPLIITGPVTVALVLGGWFILERTWFADAPPHSLRLFYVARGLVASCAITLLAVAYLRREVQKVERAQAVFREVLESAPDAVVIADQAGQIARVNVQAERMFGYSRSEFLGKTVDSLVPKRFRVRHVGHRASYFAAPHARPMGPGLDLFGLHKDGREFPVEISLSHFQTPEGVLVSAAIRNVTDRKRIEEQLQQSQKTEAMGKFAGGIAHDFNNLLVGILGHSELLVRRSQADPSSLRMAESIRTTALRARSLVHQLLTFARKQTVQHKVLNLNAVVCEVGDLLRNILGEDILLATELAPDLGCVNADRTQMEQVIVNLVVNAREAMPNGGHLLIRTLNLDFAVEYFVNGRKVPPGHYAVLSVSDEGVGMDQDTMRRIFEPFFTTKESQGTGLGLSTVYEAVKQSGGHVLVKSDIGKGAEFEVYLPRTEEPADKADDYRAVEISGGQSSGTVLVVEDEEHVLRPVCEILESDGYLVLTARSAFEAIGLSRQYQHPIHAMITDVVMPERSGLELAGLLAAERPDMSILFISGYAVEIVRNEDVKRLEAKFLSKPFTVAELLDSLREAISMKAKA